MLLKGKARKHFLQKTQVRRKEALFFCAEVSSEGGSRQIIKGNGIPAPGAWWGWGETLGSGSPR
jgi:hypothetical protein